jgi:hypothetical protein
LFGDTDSARFFKKHGGNMIIEKEKPTAAEKATSECAELLNYFLQNKTITSVEPGNTPGWVLINFEDAPADKSVRQFMTLWIGKEPFYPDDPHCWEMAIHQHVQDGGGMASAIRKIDVPEEVEDDSEEQGWASDEEVNTGSRPIGE